jgi:hypothetical protein
MTVAEVMKAYGETAREQLKPQFVAAGVVYPPREMTWIGLKTEKLLLCFARDKKGTMKKVLTYPIVGTSGVEGPKLREGDKQIPEGFYDIAGFRPHVIAHIGLDVGYPNAEDKMHAHNEHRKNLGGDIMIHGHWYSTGCLAMTDQPIEEIFTLAYDTGLKNIHLILAPCNLTKRKPDVDFKEQPLWLPALYARLTKALKQFPL